MDRESADVLVWSVQYSHRREPITLANGDVRHWRGNASVMVVARTAAEAIETVLKSAEEVKVWNVNNQGNGVLFAAQ